MNPETTSKAIRWKGREEVLRPKISRLESLTAEPATAAALVEAFAAECRFGQPAERKMGLGGG